MTPLAFLMVLTAESCSAIGQIFFKRAMGHGERRQAALLTAGVAVKALGFFMVLGLLSKFPLSYLYPFEGLDRVVLILGTTLVLKEKMTPGLWVGVVLIGAGILLVSRS